MDDNSQQKKWICFVCIQEFDEYEPYAEHIIETHEEGKNYLVCPRCQAPVRDLRAHWRAKHKESPMPKFPQFRADTIIDWDPMYRRSKRKKRKFKEGYFESRKMGKQIHFRSSWERDVMICLERCRDVTEFYGDDHLCVEYSMSGKQHRYWPDFTVKTTSGNTYVLEIKPESQTAMEMNQAKWSAAVKYCDARQWEFQVWTEQYIRKIKTRVTRADGLLSEAQVFPTKDEALKEIVLNAMKRAARDRKDAILPPR